MCSDYSGRSIHHLTNFYLDSLLVTTALVKAMGLFILRIMEEIWKKVDGFSRYEISNKGNLKANLKFRKGRNYQSIILNPPKDKDGYYRTALVSDLGTRKMKKIHRLVAEAFINNPDNKPCVNHINGIKTDNRLENLEWVTVKENNTHAIKLGLSGQAGGEKHHMAKLNAIQVEEIKRNENNLSQNKLGVKYGVSQSQIWRIINNQRWNK